MGGWVNCVCVCEIERELLMHHWSLSFSCCRGEHTICACSLYLSLEIYTCMCASRPICIYVYVWELCACVCVS